MRLFILLFAAILVHASGSVYAQTLYNSPSQQKEGARSPLNLRELLRRPTQPEASVSVPYSNPGAGIANLQFAQRQAALNQWRAQRDQQAWIDQDRTIAEAVAAADMIDNQGLAPLSPAQATPFSSPSAVLPAQPQVPMIYRGASDEGIRKPRPLFNTPR